MNDGLDPQVLRRLRPTARYVVAAELDGSSAPSAHAVGDVGAVTARHGVALCGLPVEALVIVPDLEWGQVDVSSRCGLCQDAMPSGP